jgi:hypothetical protein
MVPNESNICISNEQRHPVSENIGSQLSCLFYMDISISLNQITHFLIQRASFAISLHF